MNVIVAFARACFGRIVNSTLVRLAGNLRHAVGMRLAPLSGGLALSLVLCGTGHAGMEQVWQYKVSMLPGQVFSTLSQAEAAMRRVSVEASLLQLSSEIVTATTVARDYNVTSLAPQKGEWVYPDPWKYGTCYSSEEAMVSAAVAYNNKNNPCPSKLES